MAAISRIAPPKIEPETRQSARFCTDQGTRVASKTWVELLDEAETVAVGEFVNDELSVAVTVGVTVELAEFVGVAGGDCVDDGVFGGEAVPESVLVGEAVPDAVVVGKAVPDGVLGGVGGGATQLPLFAAPPVPSTAQPPAVHRVPLGQQPTTGSAQR